MALPPKRSSTGAEFSASSIPGVPGHRIAKDSAGEPLLLINTAPGGDRLPPPIRLENLGVDYGVHCRIWQGKQIVEEGTFTVVRCLSSDPDIATHFLRVGGPFLGCLGPNPIPAQVSHLLDTLVALFRALSEPPRRSVQGLWAELYLIAQARDSRAMLKAWHTQPGERYDFSSGSQRIEVKCAVGRARAHHFSLEQLSPPDMSDVLIASVCTERSGGGTSVGNLLADIRTRLDSDPDQLLRVEFIVGATLGNSLVRALGEAYDLEMAQQSLRFFDVAVIPRPGGSIPREVSDVRFVADLTHVEPVDITLFTEVKGLIEAALPA